MTFGSKYNNTQPKFAITITNPVYKSLKDLQAENKTDTVYPVYAVYINTKGRYGDQALVAIDDHTMVNLPMHCTEKCKMMLMDPEAIEAMNTGKAGFKIYQYTSNSGQSGLSVSWCDRIPTPDDTLPF